MIKPLSDRLRPKSLDDVVGQKHILGKDKMLRKIIESGNIPNMIFYGPSGVGKTTVARIIAENTKKKLHKLNATIATTADIKSIISEIDTLRAPEGILLYLDEIQYFNKKQQQTLLEFIENGKITLIASTTENPYFYIYGAILSRCTVFEFKPVDNYEIEKAIYNAIKYIEDDEDIYLEIKEDVVKDISSIAGGDVRKAINFFELCFLSSTFKDGRRIISSDVSRQILKSPNIRYDRKGDEHYDTLSAFQKSMRGSDPDAAIYYLAKLLSTGDLLSACRRLLVCVCEDVGLAYPQAISIVKSNVDIAMQVGLPEARIPLADAVILVSLAPKSNSAYCAINAAMDDIKKGKSYEIPRHLQNRHYDGDEVENKGQFYKYPHDFENHFVSQQYLPNELKEKSYYIPGDNKMEKNFYNYWNKIKN